MDNEKNYCEDYDVPVKHRTVDLSLLKRGDDIYIDEEWNADGGILFTEQDYEDCEEEQNLPEEPDCSNERVPSDVTDKEGMREIEVPDLISATKVLFAGHKGRMYLYLCSCLKRGWLDQLAGCKVLNRTINRDVCDFPHVDYWRIDRENFYADVEVNLTLKTDHGEMPWKGYLECWCSFEETGSAEKNPGSKRRKPRYRLDCSIEDLATSVERPADEYDRLNKYLAPYLTNDRVEEIADGLWRTACEGALTNPDLRSAKCLADKLGLSIKYCPVYEHRDVDSIVFFKEDELEIGEDRYEKDETGKIRRHIKADRGEPKIISANTIVVNTNKIRREFSSFNIFHECFHYDQHYLFYCLQEMASNDRRVVPTKKIMIKKGEEHKDPLYFMENQANRGGLALMMPAAHTKRMIREECGRAGDCAHPGEMYEKAGQSMHGKLHVPEFRIRQRMIQLGNVRARGAMNKANRRSIAPFAFNPDSWRDSDHTFIIDRAKVNRIMRENEEFRDLIDSGRYVYADGHVVKNTPDCVRWDSKSDGYLLTAWAYAHVDECCLRFKQKYVQQNIGRYVYGRLYFDDEYVRQCEFYMSDYINKKQLSFSDAKFEYENDFPGDFKEAFEKLMHKNNETQETMAEKLGTTRLSLRNWLRNPERMISADFVIYIAQLWKLPDFISGLLLESAGITLNRKNPRHRALEHIRTTLWDQGIDKANNYLKKNNLEMLSL